MLNFSTILVSTRLARVVRVAIVAPLAGFSHCPLFSLNFFLRFSVLFILSGANPRSSHRPVDVCPTSDFPPIRFNESDKNDFSGKIWSNCAHAFAEVDCLDIGFQKPPSATIYQPSNLRLPGTEPRSTLPGQISTPLSGWTYTWSLGTKEYVVTAFLPTGTVTSTPTTSAFESGTTSSQTATTIVASSGATVTGSAMPSTTSTSSGAFGRTRPLRSHGEQVLVIVIGLLLILFLVTVGMYL